jgi:hypothetical protein
MRAWVMLLAIGVLLAAAVLLLAMRTEFGPVLLELTPQHGVHAGDLLVAILAVAALLLIGRRILR